MDCFQIGEAYGRIYVVWNEWARSGCGVRTHNWPKSEIVDILVDLE